MKIRGWTSLTLEQIFPYLEEEILLPLPSFDKFRFVINKCRQERDQKYGLRVYALLQTRRFETDGALGNYVVPMLVEIERIPEAQSVFNRLIYPNECSWEALISGYINCGSLQCALALYRRKNESIRLNGHILASLVKTCAKLKDLGSGIKVHDEISRIGPLTRDHFLRCMLVNMYGKCGSIMKAQKVFDELCCRDVVSWTALISVYAGNGDGKEALRCFKQMQYEGIFPNSATFVSILMACGDLGAIEEGRKIHVDIEHEGLLGADLVGNTLIRMYVKCGVLSIARQVFNKLPINDVASWNVLLTGYAEHGFSEEAIQCFEHMRHNGVCPNAVSYVCVLKSCGIIGDAQKGGELHAEIGRLGFVENNLFVGSALIDMYAKCGALSKAQEVFEEVPAQDVVSWTALVTGYANEGLGDKALQHFKRMHVEGIIPNSVTFISCLNACGSIGALEKGQEIHVEIERRGFLERDCMVGNTLLDMYAKCGSLVMAQEVFNELLVQDVVSWNALIGGYAEHGHALDVLQCFEEMQLQGVCPNAVTFIHGLKACSTIDDVDKAEEIHFEIERRGLLERELIGNTLVSMYAKCGLLSKSQQVFETLKVRDVVSWTSLIAGYAEHVDGERALTCFEQMQVEGVTPNAVALICALKACSNLGAPEKGQTIHAEIERQGLLESDIVVGNSLVDMYARCGLFGIAQEVFDKIPVRDVISWNALITGYAEHGRVDDVLKCFDQMHLVGISPNYVTFVCCLKACASIGAIDKGNEIHAAVERRGLLAKDPIGNTLVSMYAKCGLLGKAQQVFDKLPIRDVVTWTALMSGYAHIGESLNVFHHFDRMLGEGVKPNPVTFLVVLNACSRTGLFGKCQTYFEAMSEDHGMVPTVEHLSCVVDVLGRAGQIDDAFTMVKRMPFSPNPVLWHSILGACKNSGNMSFGKHVFDHAMYLDNMDSVAYFYMSQIYAAGECHDPGNNMSNANLE